MASIKRLIYISADYSPSDGDRNVIDILEYWNRSSRHSIEFTDTARVISGSVTSNQDCRFCELKAEFNKQINVSSIILFIIGDKTKNRTAGSTCGGPGSFCTPYKQNRNGISFCKFPSTSPTTVDVGNVNNYSFIEHEYRQAIYKNKQIYIFYNSLNNMFSWLPRYMNNSCLSAYPFWINNANMEKCGNYQLFKSLLDYD